MQQTKDIPFSKGLPILGNLFAYKSDRLKMLTNHRDRLGDIFKIKVGPKSLIVVNKPEYVQHIMLKNMKNYIKKTNFELLFGQSIFIANGAEWKRQRNMVQPLFSIKYINDCIDDIHKVTLERLEQYYKQNNDGVDIRQLFTKITFDVILEMIIGLDYHDSLEMIDKALVTLTFYLTNDSYRILPLPEKWDKEKQAFNAAMKELDTLIYQCIDNAKKNPDGKSLVHVFLRAAREQKDFEADDLFIRNAIVTMTFAGYETSALTLSWLSYALSQNEDWQQKCITEAKAFDTSDITLDSLKNVPHIEAAIFETMRLYPAGWAFTRFCVEDDEIDGYPIKADDIVLVSPFLTHRDPKLWEDVERYKPERFFGKTLFDYGKFQYFPFGAGPRICIGMQLGMVEMKVMAIDILKKYKFKLVGEHPRLDARATIYSKNGYQIKLEEHQ
jgi:cytochrome P450